MIKYKGMSGHSKIREDFGSRPEDLVLYVVFHSYLYYLFLRSVSHYIVSYSLSDFSRESDDFLVSNILNRRKFSVDTISLQDFRRTYQEMKKNILKHGLPLFYSKAVPKEFGGKGKDPSHQASVNILLELLDRIGDEPPNPDSLFKEICLSISKHIVESENKKGEKSEKGEDVVVGFKDLSMVVGLYLEDYSLYPEFEGFSWIKESSRLLSRVIESYLSVRKKYPKYFPLPKEVTDKFSSSIDDLLSYMIKDLYDRDFSPKAVSNLVRSFPRISVEWLSSKDPREGEGDEYGAEVYKIYEESFEDEESVLPVRDKNGEGGRYRNPPLSFLSLTVSSKDFVRREYGSGFILKEVGLLDEEEDKKDMPYSLRFSGRFNHGSEEINRQLFRAIAFTNFSYFFFVTYINGPTSNYVRIEDMYSSIGPDFDAIEKDYSQEFFTSGFEVFDSAFLSEEIDKFVIELDNFVGLDYTEKKRLFGGISKAFSRALVDTLKPPDRGDHGFSFEFSELPSKSPYGEPKISALVFSSHPVKSTSLKKEAVLYFRMLRKRSEGKIRNFVSPFTYVTESLKNPLVFFSKYKKYFCELDEFYKSSVFIKGVFDKSARAYRRVEMKDISPSDYVFGVVAFDYESPYSYYGAFTEKLGNFLKQGDKYVEMMKKYSPLTSKMAVMVFYPKEGSEAPLILASLPNWVKVVRPFRDVVEAMVKSESCEEKLSKVMEANSLFKGEVVENLGKYLGENHKEVKPTRVQFFDPGSGQNIFQTSFINPFSRDGVQDLVLSEAYGKTRYATSFSSSYSSGEEEKLDKFSPFKFLGKTAFYLNPGITKTFKLFEWPFVSLDLSYSTKYLGLSREEAYNMFLNSPNLWEHFVDSMGRVYESLFNIEEVSGEWVSVESSMIRDFVYKMAGGDPSASGGRAQALSLYGHLPHDLCFYGEDGKLAIKVYGEEGPFKSLLEENEKLSKSVFHRLKKGPKKFTLERVKEEINKNPRGVPPLVSMSVLEDLVPVDFALVNILPAEGYYEYLPALLFSGVYLRKNGVKTELWTKGKSFENESLFLRALEKTSLSYKSDGSPYKNIIKFLSSKEEKSEKDIRREVLRMVFGWEGDDTTPKFGPLASHLRFFFTITKRILQSHLEEYEKTKDKKGLIDKIKSMGINEFGMSSYISLLILFYDKKEGTLVSKVFPILHLPKECWEDLGLDEIVGVRRKE
jgi:hypothetical protein